MSVQQPVPARARVIAVEEVAHLLHRTVLECGRAEVLSPAVGQHVPPSPVLESSLGLNHHLAPRGVWLERGQPLRCAPNALLEFLHILYLNLALHPTGEGGGYVAHALVFGRDAVSCTSWRRSRPSAAVHTVAFSHAAVATVTTPVSNSGAHHFDTNCAQHRADRGQAHAPQHQRPDGNKSTECNPHAAAAMRSALAVRPPRARPGEQDDQRQH
mmetsp:Transcript_3300/g.8199  ORF Transcript_3300/g.8199 Transcript_3300/m.8199 type:complete len:214 (+) Transcript_3300:854-1495(+)